MCAVGTVPRTWHSAVGPIFVSSFNSKVGQIGACVVRECMVKFQYMCVPKADLGEWLLRNNTYGCLLASTYTCPHIHLCPHKQTPAHTNTHHHQEKEASKKKRERERWPCKIIQLDLGHVNSNINILLLWFHPERHIIRWRLSLHTVLSVSIFYHIFFCVWDIIWIISSDRCSTSWVPF